MTAMLSERLASWVREAPWLVMIMLTGAAVIFWSVLRGKGLEEWVRRRALVAGVLGQGLLMALLFLAILWGVRVTLARTEYDFRRQHGRVSEANLASVQTIWGKPHVQRDLVVQQTYQELVKEEVRDPLGRIVMREHWETRYLDENSVTRTRGQVRLTRNYRRKGTALYPGFEVDCRFQYTIHSFTGRNTDARFVFPLSPGQTVMDGFTVLVDGQDQSSRLAFNYAEVSWTLPMTPGQEYQVDISYKSRGMERFYYQVADVREIRDFLLNIELPDIPLNDVNYPEGCITPTERRSIADGHGSELIWKMNKALTTQGMGIALPRPSQPGRQVARILRYAWRGGMLFLVAVTIAGIVFGRGFNLLRTALLGGVFVAEFMLLSAVSDYLPWFWLSWLLAAGVAVILAWLVLGGRKAPREMLLPAVVFLAVYPLLSLPEDINVSLMTAMDVLVIVYLAVLAGVRGREAQAA